MLRIFKIGFKIFKTYLIIDFKKYSVDYKFDPSKKVEKIKYILYDLYFPSRLEVFKCLILPL